MKSPTNRLMARWLSMAQLAGTLLLLNFNPTASGVSDG